MPAMPCRVNRRRHRHTDFAPRRSSRAISLLSNPEAAKSTILDRNTKRAGVERPRAQRSSSMRSLSERLIAGAALITILFRECRGDLFRVVVRESRAAEPKPISRRVGFREHNVTISRHEGCLAPMRVVSTKVSLSGLAPLAPWRFAPTNNARSGRGSRQRRFRPSGLPRGHHEEPRPALSPTGSGSSCRIGSKCWGFRGAAKAGAIGERSPSQLHGLVNDARWTR